MQNAAVSETSFIGLIANLREEVKALVKDEVRLAKTELSEKLSKMGKNAMWLAIGAFVGYGGLIILLAGIGALIAHLFERGGMDRMMAAFLGLGIVGFVVLVLGGLFIMKALGGFKKESLAPEKTIDTIRHVRETMPGAHPSMPKAYTKEHEPKQSSDEIKTELDTTQDLMKDTVAELRYRLTPGYMKKVVVGHVRHHPLQTGVIGAISSGIVGLLVMRKRRHNHNGVV
jgi:hypothetical protein